MSHLPLLSNQMELRQHRECCAFSTYTHARTLLCKAIVVVFACNGGNKYPSNWRPLAFCLPSSQSLSSISAVSHVHCKFFFSFMLLNLEKKLFGIMNWISVVAFKIEFFKCHFSAFVYSYNNFSSFTWLVFISTLLFPCTYSFIQSVSHSLTHSVSCC